MSKMEGLIAALGGVTGGDGSPVLASCPAHSDGDPSLSIAIGESGKVLLNCFAGCSFAAIGRALGSDVDLGGTDWVWPDSIGGGVAASGPSVASDAQRAGLLRYIAKCEARLWEPEGAAALAYARERFGLSDTLIKGFRLGFSGTESEVWEAVGSSWVGAPRLVVPFFDFRGMPVGAQGRALTDHKTRWAGLTGAGWARSSLFRPGLFDSFDEGYALVCEGPSDALTAAASGIDAVAIRGASLRSEAVLAEFSGAMDGRTVVVAGDADSAGAVFTDTVVTALLAAGVDARPMRVPLGNDINEWFAQAGTFFDRDLRDAMAMAEAPIVQAQRAVIARNARVAANIWDGWQEAYPPGTSHVGACEAVLWYFRATGRDCCYVQGYKGPSLYDGELWNLGKANAVRSALQEAGLTAKQHSDDAHPWHAEIVQLGNKLGSTGFLDSVTKELAAMVPVYSPDEFDAVEHLLQAANGVVDLKTGELLRPDPSYLITSKVKVAYRPEAECPTWVRYLGEVMREENDPDKPMGCYLQRLVGYGLTGSTSEQCFVVHYGTGSNGKSVFMDTLSKVFDSGMCRTVPFTVFEDGYAGGSGGPSSDIARLRGARLVFTSEGNGKPMKEGLLKMLTGGDKITARHLFSEEIEFKSRFLIQLATNYKPDFRGVDEGLWRRVKLIKWDRHFSDHERDHSLNMKLLKEAEGVFAWAVRGAMHWYRSGLREPRAVSEDTHDYRDTADILAGFYPGKLVDDPAAERVSLADVYFAFASWADSEGIEAYSRRWLRANLDTRGVKFVRATAGMVAVGVRLVQ